VRACQRKLSALVVVKRGWRPALIHVTLSAFGYAILSRKLAGVQIGVTGLTIFGRALELDFVCPGQSFVTFVTSDPAMRTR